MSVGDHVLELMSRTLPAYVEIVFECSSLETSFDFLKMLETTCDVLTRAESLIENDSRNLCPIVYIDYGVSEQLQVSKSFHEIAQIKLERVLLYLVEGVEFLHASGEIYASKVAMPESVESSCELTFACFRDAESIANDWEYSLGLYVARKKSARHARN